MNGDSNSDEIDEIRLALEAAEEEASTIPSSDAELNVTRTWITKTTFVLYVTVIAFLIALLAVEAAGWGAKDMIEHAKDVIKTFIMPIVTLVLGFYFGRSQ